MWHFAALLVALLAGCTGSAAASYLDEVGEEVFRDVYAQLAIHLPEKVAHDPQVWQTLDQLKREPCDQKAIGDLALLLDKLGYRREAAIGPYNFVKRCGAPVTALNQSIDRLLKLADYANAVEVADEYVRRAPTVSSAHYLRGVALEGIGDYKRAISDYANAIELYSSDKATISFRAFQHMAESYAKLGQYCEALTPILTWMAFDPVRRDTSRTQKIVSEYERQGNCPVQAGGKERFALRGGNRVVQARAEINGVRGVFIIDTGASFVSVKKNFADRAQIAYANGGDVTLHTANGTAKGKLAKADKVALGRLQSSNVPVIVQDTDGKSYGTGVDGLLGMSFLSRFEVQMADGFLEVRSRQRK